jgi:hypothetical protein
MYKTSINASTLPDTRMRGLEKQVGRIIFLIAWLGFAYFLYLCWMKLLDDDSDTIIRKIFKILVLS